MGEGDPARPSQPTGQPNSERACGCDAARRRKEDPPRRRHGMGNSRVKHQRCGPAAPRPRRRRGPTDVVCLPLFLPLGALVALLVIPSGSVGVAWGWVLAAWAGLLMALALWRLARRRTARYRWATIPGDRLFQSLLRHAPDLALVIDGHGGITYLSPAAGRLVGLEPNDCVGMDTADLVHPEDLPLLTGALRDLEEEDAAVLPFDLRLQRADGSILWVESKLSDLREDPAVAGFVLNVHEITQRKAIEAKLVHQALHDPLTALPNRLLFHRRVEEALAVRNGRPRLLAVLFLDIDDFKTVNDTLGHAVGDELLLKVALRINGCLRPDDLAARLGGDEFGVLLVDLPSMHTAVQVARGLVEVVAQPLALHGLTLTMHACVGIALTNEGASAASLLRDADMAMRQAKSQGKGQVAVFDAALQNGALQRLSLRADLANALARRELFLHYQPIVELGSGRAVATEALLRWQHPQLGTLLPDEFLPVAEETRLMRPIGRWVLERACLQAQACRARFPGQPLSISVNLTSTQLDEGAVVEDVERALENSGLPPACLVLELTESTLLRDTQSAAATVHSLKELGIRLAVDDFGTGYCSLSYLQRLPVDVLKIDRSFVAGLGSDGRQAKLTEGIVQMARTLDMQIIAEGIESSGQLAHLRRLGCDLGQGYLFSYPLGPEDLEDLLATRHGECLPASLA
ncbi:MAG: EAL domain-containing protein [Nitriliruptorales bacterium]|nr:EAL domain-containing protein [Nitriliruptorales bacterium]